MPTGGINKMSEKTLVGKKTFNLPFGKGTKKISIPLTNLQEAEGFDMDYFATPKGIKVLEEALDNPVGKPPLEQLCRNKERIAVLVDDNTRPTPAAKILPLVIERIIKANVDKRKITIIIAKGTHRALTDKELKEKIGSFSRGFHVVQHDCRDEKKMVYLGDSSQGKVLMNKYAAEADLRIGIGQLSLSPFAGISSGAKLWLPGISSVETIRQNHKLAKDKTSDFGILKGNVLRKDMEQSASLIGDNFYLGVILNPDREIISAVAGDLIQAHRKGAQELISHVSVSIPSKADLGIIDTNPYDHSFYHVLHKTLVMKFFVKEGGDIICLGYCDHGLGPEDFIQLLEKDVDAGEIEEKIKKDEIMPDRGYITVRVKDFMKRFNLFIYTRNTLRDRIKKTGISCLDSLSEKTQDIRDKKVFLAPYPVVLPVLDS